MVARSLERNWEEKLRAVEAVETEHRAWQTSHPHHLSTTERDRILALGVDVPQLWAAPTTTATDRKQIIRLLIKEVIVNRNRVRGKVWFQLNWQTGATTEHWYHRKTDRYAEHADRDELR